MSAFFFDSSALVKRYGKEVGSAWVSSIVDLTAGNSVYVVSLTEVEVASALSRKFREGLLSTADMASAMMKLQDDFVASYQVSGTDEAVIA